MPQTLQDKDRVTAGGGTEISDTGPPLFLPDCHANVSFPPTADPAPAARSAPRPERLWDPDVPFPRVHTTG